MANKFTLSVGLAHELENAFNRSGYWDGDLFKKLVSRDNIAKVRDMLMEHATIQPVEHQIDGDADPCDFLFQEHTDHPVRMYKQQEKGKLTLTRKNDNLYLNERKLALYMPKKQMEGGIFGEDLMADLASKDLVGANVLAYLIKHPRLVLGTHVFKDFENQHYFFWGTIFVKSGDQFVCCMSDIGISFVSGTMWVKVQWDHLMPAVILE